LAGSDHFDNSGTCGNQRNPIQAHAHLDDCDCLIARHIFGDENVDFALHKIVHHQLFARKLLVKTQHIDDIAVWKLEPDRLRGDRRRSYSWCRGAVRYLGNRRWLRTLGRTLS
jgi:hypothetical protein